MFKWLILFLGLTVSSAQAIVLEKTTVQASAKIPVVIVLPAPAHHWQADQRNPR